MGKNPADQFYFGDYQRDTRALSCLSRGAWMDCLCAMHYAEPRGRLSLPISGYARLFGEDERTASVCILEIVSLGVADCMTKEGILDPADVPCPGPGDDPKIEVVTNGNGKITLINRRMDRKEKIKRQGRLRQDRYREKRKDNGDVTDPSSSSPSNSGKEDPDFQGKSGLLDLPLCPAEVGIDGPFYLTKSGKKLSGFFLERFNEFWNAFGKKEGKAEAADAWLNLAKLFGRNEFIAKIPEIIAAAKEEARRRPTLEQQGKSVKWAQGWLSGRRFEDEVYKTARRSIYDTPGEETTSEKIARWEREAQEEREAMERDGITPDMTLKEFREKWEREKREENEQKRKGGPNDGKEDEPKP